MTEPAGYHAGFWRGYYEACRELLPRVDPGHQRLVQAHARMARRKLAERGIKVPPPPKGGPRVRP